MLIFIYLLIAIAVVPYIYVITHTAASAFFDAKFRYNRNFLKHINKESN